jgi:hypothetical protein
MIERPTNTDINEGFTFRLAAGNDIALPECPANVLETVPPSPKSHRHPRFTSENPLKTAYHDGPARRERRGQPPAHNTNPHSTRSIT